MKNRILKSATVFLFFLGLNLFSQTGKLSGTVFSASDNQPLAFADVVLQNTNYYTTTDKEGKFSIENIKPGIYNLQVSFLGFQTYTLSELTINNIRSQYLDIYLKENLAQLDEVVIKTSAFQRKAESPVSASSIGVTEIMRSPGANRDISSVIQNLPGVATTSAFRNDLIVRGGAPGENRFYMDGIEIPNINHFATQGSSGGPVGMINVNFINNVNFYTGAFPVSRGNALSSVMDIYTKNANPDKLSGNITIGSSDFGLTIDTPTGENSGMLLSARRSYLQFLFEQLKLPFLPIYNDFQYVHKFQFDDKNQLKIIGLGAIDNFELNTKVNEGVTDEAVLKRNNYILNNIPKFEQWNYAIGANWRRNTTHGYHQTVLSRNMLNNTSNKYRYNIETEENKLLDYQSQEIENKLRYEYHYTDGRWKWYTGLGWQYVKYNNKTFQQINIGDLITNVNIDSELSLQKYALFAQVNRSFLKDKLDVSLSLRSDFNSYSAKMANPLEQLSPRLAISYNFNNQHTLSGSIGNYFQLPAYTVLGYKDDNGNLINKENDVTYINVWQYVSGYSWTPTDYFQLKMEGFYKKYDQYPFSVLDGISLANLGSDYGVIGNTEVISNAKGRSYGFEISGTQKLTKKIFGSFTYTYVRSEFENNDDKYVASAWDNRHIFNVLGGYKFSKDWELGLKFRFLGGAPFTPFNTQVSALKTVWDVNQQGVLDYTNLNTERLKATHGLDLRIDKKWYFNKWALDLYLDVQNVYAAVVENPPYFSVIYDEQGLPLPSESDPNSYRYELIENESGNVLPSIGITVDF